MDTSLLRTDPLILAITAEVRAFMRHYDASHAFDHVERVLGLALAILAAEPPRRPALDARVVALAALLHDVGDRKYLAAGQDGAAVAHGLLRAYSADEALAARVQAICSGVSYTSEMEDPERTRVLMERYPELAVVQDADRIDAIGAVGIGRLFTYGGAKTDRSMASSMEHMDEKLLRLVGMMKTAKGREMAKERTRRMEEFKRYWKEEMSFAELAMADGPGPDHMAAHS